MQSEPTTVEQSQGHRGNERGTDGPSARWIRVVLVLLGLVAPQIILYGPSLRGVKVLLPLDILGTEEHYLPTPASGVAPLPKDYGFVDEVLIYTPTLEYAEKEVRAGHIPFWNPQNFAGAPFATFPKYSLNFLLFCLWPHPITLACLQLIKSVIAGLGAYLFFRRVLGTGFWASAVGAWCYPVTGFFVHWQGHGLTHVVAWFPWILLTVNWTIRQPKGWGPILLSVFTALAVLAGQLDVAALVLMSSGLYAISCFVEINGLRNWRGRTIAPVAALVLGWGLGLCISAVYVAPLVEYSRTGERFSRRAAGEEERPPVGIAALPQVVLPNMYGSTQKGSLRFVDGAQAESSAAGYAGLVATLFFAPLAFCHSGLKNRALWWLGLLALSLGWVLDVPGLVQLMRTPVANMFSWNRWMMLTGFALTALTVIGIDALIKGMARPRPWFALPALLAAGVCFWCLYRMDQMPQELRDFSAMNRASPYAVLILKEMTVGQATALVRSYFHLWYGVGAAFGLLTLVGWGVLLTGARVRTWIVALGAGLMLAELLIYAYDVNPQFEREMYYPRLEALEELKQFPPGRILCVHCLPPELNLMIGLPDIRGYDAVDPKRLLDVMELAREPGTPVLPYARTQWFVPRLAWTNEGSVRISPVLSMLNVRYLIWFRDLGGGIKTMIRREGYVVVENEHALPRTFVPQTIESVGEGQGLMDRLRDGTFDAARLSYVSERVDLPAECRGTTRIADEESGRVTVDAHMETAGMVVLADLWDKGWRANVDGTTARILVVNHAIRGVVVPAGEHHIIFRYEPDSVRIGLIVSGVALVVMLGWLTGVTLGRLQKNPLE